MSVSLPYRFLAILVVLGLLFLITQKPMSDSTQCPTTTTQTIDESINQALCPIAQNLDQVVFVGMDIAIPQIGSGSLPFTVILLVISGLFLSIYLKFINIRGMRYGLRAARGHFSSDDESNKGEGEISHFQALTAALSGTVGLGNIAGVAVAITAGGPGAAFWMMIIALILAATKFAECTLGNKYRIVHPDGTISGGAMYYLSRGFARRGIAMTHFGTFLSTLFALFCIGASLGSGNMFQANQTYQQILESTGGNASILYGYGWVVGLIIAILVGLVIISGIKGITHVTEKLVPSMGILYILACLTIIFVHRDNIDTALLEIVQAAFTPEAQYGGFLGALVWGIKRAVFSNEAGMGSSPTAYAAVRTNTPVSTGMVALLEPFIDTVIVCLMTALVIVVTGVHNDNVSEGIQGVTLTSQAFGTVVDWFPHVLTVAIILFAFSTMITWSYYGLKCWTYLCGNSRWSANSFKIIFCLFIIIGAASDLREIIRISEAMVFLMIVPNVIGLAVLAPEIKKTSQHSSKHINYSPRNAQSPATKDRTLASYWLRK